MKRIEEMNRQELIEEIQWSQALSMTNPAMPATSRTWLRPSARRSG